MRRFHARLLIELLQTWEHVPCITFLLGNNYIHFAARERNAWEVLKSRCTCSRNLYSPLSKSPTAQSGYFQRKMRVPRRSSLSIGAGRELFYLTRYCYSWCEDTESARAEEKERDHHLHLNDLPRIEKVFLLPIWMPSLLYFALA